MADTNLTGITAGSFIQKSVELAKEAADKIEDKTHMKPVLPPPTSNENEEIEIDLGNTDCNAAEYWWEDSGLTGEDSFCDDTNYDHRRDIPASNLKQTIQSKKIMKDPNLIPGRFSDVERDTEPNPGFDSVPNNTDYPLK